MRRIVAHFFVEDLSHPALSDADLHHLSRVLRLRPGELVSGSDGRGGFRLFVWNGPGAQLSPLSEPAWEAAPEPVLTVGFALTKGGRPEGAVQKLTEAGVDRIVVMTAQRSVARWAPHNAERQLARLREVARQAAMQSRRCWLPAVEGLVPLEGLVPAEGLGQVEGQPAGESFGLQDRADTDAQSAGTVALAVPGGAPLTLVTPTVLVGPEGGWTDDELAAVPPCHHVSLGPHVLRAETAAMAAGVLLAALRAGLIAPVAVPAHGGLAPG
jgi:16S rRNA (uracil1498-N3)-methyltransferase